MTVVGIYNILGQLFHFASDSEVVTQDVQGCDQVRPLYQLTQWPTCNVPSTCNNN